MRHIGRLLCQVPNRRKKCLTDETVPAFSSDRWHHHRLLGGFFAYSAHAKVAYVLRFARPLKFRRCPHTARAHIAAGRGCRRANCLINGTEPGAVSNLESTTRNLRLRTSLKFYASMALMASMTVPRKPSFSSCTTPRMVEPPGEQTASFIAPGWVPVAR